MGLATGPLAGFARRVSRRPVGNRRVAHQCRAHVRRDDRARDLGGIMRGIALRRKSDPRTAARLGEWLERLRRDHGNRILPVTDRIALEWGRIAALRPRGDIDGLIAATAIVHDLDPGHTQRRRF
jgi:hypothetical protein